MERVSVIRGAKDSNIVVVAPHGADDDLTVEATKVISKHAAGATPWLGDRFHAVINNGFERSSTVDVFLDKADCNNIEHIKADEVVFEEFMKPILDFRKKAFYQAQKSYQQSLRFWGIPSSPFFVYYVHGFGKQQSGVDIILGIGRGVKSDSLTMQEFRIRALYDYLTAAGLKIYIGKGGGKYAARQPTNLNQWFRKEQVDDSVETIQLELSANVRNDLAALTTISHALKVISQAEPLTSGDDDIEDIPEI
jgi:hypothetical protein